MSEHKMWDMKLRLSFWESSYTWARRVENNTSLQLKLKAKYDYSDF